MVKWWQIAIICITSVICFFTYKVYTDEQKIYEDAKKWYADENMGRPLQDWQLKTYKEWVASGRPRFVRLDNGVNAYVEDKK